MPATHAAALAAMDKSLKYGRHESTNSVALAPTGPPPKRFRDFALSAKNLWAEKPEGRRSAAV